MPYFHGWVLGTSRNVLLSCYNSRSSVQPIIIFVERKGYNFKEWQCTSLYLKSKIDWLFFIFWQMTVRLLEVATLIKKKKKKKEKHKILRRRPTIKIRLQELSLYITRIISKTYFQIYLVAAYRKVLKNSPKSHAEVICVM